jgi:DNA-binding transcriptional ArsR family regulator
VLREAGLVEVRPEGKRRWYGLRAEPLAEVAEWLEPYSAYWSERLDAHLEGGFLSEEDAHEGVAELQKRYADRFAS